jgi:RimJ/RimL family protein N-acetyltransferase
MAADPYAHLAVARIGSLRIRHKHLDDLVSDYRWRTDPDLARFDGLEPMSIPFEEYVRRMETEVRYPSGARSWFTLDVPGEPPLGSVMVYNVSSGGDCAEIGLVLAERQGTGLGKAVVVAFTRYLFANHPHRRIMARCLDWNLRARRCFAAAGYQEVTFGVDDGRVLIHMEARREWWLMWDAEGRFDAIMEHAAAAASS